MKNLFSTILGLPSRYAVVLESEDVLGESSPQVVFTGPLADVFTQALDQVLAKDSGDSLDGGDPTVPDEPAQETGINIENGERSAQPGEEIEPVETTTQPDLVTKTVLESQSLHIANEGIKGAFYGALAGLYGWGISGAIMSHAIELRKKELDDVAKALEKALKDDGKEAVREGKISADDFKKKVNIGWRAIIRGLILGSTGPIYGAIKGSESENLYKELQKKSKQLNRILEEASKKKGVSLESQAQDAVLLQTLHQAMTPQKPDDEEYEILYAVDENQINAENVIEVANLLKTENPETVSVLIDSELPCNDISEDVASDDAVSLEEEGADTVVVKADGDSTEEVVEQAEATQDNVEDQINPLKVSLEQLVLGMGGKVFYSFGEYVASRRK